MKLRWAVRALLLIVLAAVSIGLTSCTSGGGGFVSQSLNIPVAVSWPKLAPGAMDLNGAQSAHVTVKTANADGTDLQMDLNRTNAAASTDHFNLTATGTMAGTHDLNLTFYNMPNGQANPQGVIVGQAAQALSVPSGASGVSTIPVSLVAPVASVVLADNQTVVIGSAFLPTFSALDGAGNIAAVGPTDATFQIISGASNVQIVNVTLPGQSITQQWIEGIELGAATVSVTVGGVTSAPKQVTVVAPPQNGGGGPSNPGVVAEASNQSGAPVVRVTFVPGLLGSSGIQQFKLFRLPDFPDGISGTVSGGIPVATVPGIQSVVTDLPTPNFYYRQGLGYLAATAQQSCEVVTPANAATLDVGFVPGSSYRYQVSAVILTQPGASICTETNPLNSTLCTPVNAVVETSPSNQSSNVDIKTFNPTFGSRVGADVFQVEVSTDATFKTANRIFRQQVISKAPNADGVTQSLLSPVDLTVSPELLRDPVFAAFVSAQGGNQQIPTIYWRVGARHDEDVPGPVHWITQNAIDTDRTFRFVYDSPFSFTPAPIAPPPPGRALPRLLSRPMRAQRLRR